jgi:hypothetical protein
MLLLLIFKVKLMLFARNDHLDAMIYLEIYLLRDIFQCLVFLSEFVEFVVAFLLGEAQVD